MDTLFLKTFIQVVDEGSIAAVARKQALTPAAINLRIRKLEGELGTRLVTRAGRTLRPTPEGDQIYHQAKRVLDEVRKLRVGQSGNDVWGQLFLGAFDSALSTLIPPVLGALFTRYPNLEVRLAHGYSNSLYSKVRDEELDAAIILEPQFQLPKNFEWRCLRSEELVVIAPEAHAENDPHQILRSQPLISYDRSLWGGRAAADYLHQHNIRPKIRIETASINVIAILVGNQLGVSLVPDPNIDLQSSRARKILLPDATLGRRVGLLWNRQAIRAALIEEIYELALTVVSNSYKAESVPSITVD